MTVKITGELEVDVERGVVYFHSGETGCSLMRICGLQFPTEFNPNVQTLDVTLKGVTPHPVAYTHNKPNW